MNQSPAPEDPPGPSEGDLDAGSGRREGGSRHAVFSLLNARFGTAVDAMNSLGTLLIIANMVLVCSDVLTRWLFNRPIYGVDELVGLSIVSIIFLQLASTLRHGRMARADIFIDGYRRRNPIAGGILQGLFDFAGLFVCAIIVVATLPRFGAAWSGGEFVGVHGQFTAPTWPVRLIVIIGAATAALQFGIHLCMDVRRAIAGRL